MLSISMIFVELQIISQMMKIKQKIKKKNLIDLKMILIKKTLKSNYQKYVGSY